MLRFGVITHIDESKALVRVQFADVDNTLSYWLPVLKAKTLKDKAYWMPDIGEHVACLLDEQAEEGVVLGAIYSTADKVPVISKDKCHVQFDDKTIIEYDRAQHKLYVKAKGDVDVNAEGKCSIQCNNSVLIKSKSDITIQAPSISMRGGSPANAVFEGAFTLKGNLTVDGNIVATGSIIDSGGNTNHHSH